MKKLMLGLKNQYEIAIYGDSISKGVVLEDGKYKVLNENYGTILASQIKGNLFNRSKFGVTLGRAMKRTLPELLTEKPDMVLIEFGGNDCDFKWQEIADNPYAQHDPNTEFNLFSNLLRALVDTLTKNNIIPVLLNLPPLDADRYFNWVSKQNAENAANILKWLESVNKIYWWQERYNAAIVETAAQTDTLLIDIRSAFLRHSDYRRYICMDGIHPNREGHQLIADRVQSALHVHADMLFKTPIPEKNPGLSGAMLRMD